MTTLPTRTQIDAAQPLEFDKPRADRQANITIEIAPDGLHIRAEYTGTLASIPAAIERLNAAGIVELVNASRISTTTNNTPHKPTQRVQAEYAADGSACCPVHHKTLSTGQYGAYCSAKAQPGQTANSKGYCGLKFDI